MKGVLSCSYRRPQTVEVKEIRVLTSKQIAEEYGTTPGVIKKNFSNNRERFVEGKHYISLTGDELRAFKNQVNNVHLVANRTSHLYLWTEKGALLHAKSLNTDKAWEVYDYLVDFYFRAKEKRPEKKEIVPVPAKTVEQVKEGYDIAPLFREVLEMLPLEALDEMEKAFRIGHSKAIKKAATSVLAEKMKRQLM